LARGMEQTISCTCTTYLLLRYVSSTTAKPTKQGKSCRTEAAPLRLAKIVRWRQGATGIQLGVNKLMIVFPISVLSARRSTAENTEWVNLIRRTRTRSLGAHGSRACPQTFSMGPGEARSKKNVGKYRQRIETLTICMPFAYW
jgi:hypothetical protein